jgi:hypothetical protein
MIIRYTKESSNSSSIYVHPCISIFLGAHAYLANHNQQEDACRGKSYSIIEQQPIPTTKDIFIHQLNYEHKCDTKIQIE